MRIFISTGEPSGDLHAANLVHALKTRLPEAEIVGFGGPRMQAAGATVLYPLVELAVMWFGRVLLNLHKFLALASQADRYFRHQKPDVVILIDYPGFHWWIAWRAKVRGIPVVYYVPPQIWAWAGWRVDKMRKYVDHVLCSLPFEPAWYHARGVPQAEYVGHPYFDELGERVLDPGFLADQVARGGPRVVLLPGSRTQEILKNFPMMLAAARKLSAQLPATRFLVSCLHERHQALVNRLIQEETGLPRLEVHAGRTPELIRVADIAWAVSGSVGLELMNEALPSVIVYKVKPVDLKIARRFIKSRYISLVNLLADFEVMPEYLTGEDVSNDMTRWAHRWLTDPHTRSQTAQALIALRERVAQPGATARAADRIVDVIRHPRPRQAQTQDSSSTPDSSELSSPSALDAPRSSSGPHHRIRPSARSSPRG